MSSWQTVKQSNRGINSNSHWNFVDGHGEGWRRPSSPFSPFIFPLPLPASHPPRSKVPPPSYPLFPLSPSLIHPCLHPSRSSALPSHPKPTLNLPRGTEAGNYVEAWLPTPNPPQTHPKPTLRNIPCKSMRKSSTWIGQEDDPRGARRREWKRKGGDTQNLLRPQIPVGSAPQTSAFEATAKEPAHVQESDQVQARVEALQHQMSEEAADFDNQQVQQQMSEEAADFNKIRADQERGEGRGKRGTKNIPKWLRRMPRHW